MTAELLVSAIIDVMVIPNSLFCVVQLKPFSGVHVLTIMSSIKPDCPVFAN